jgi:sulfite reductase beta subunit-like hemoprotein
LQEWIPASEIVRVAETVRRLFDRLGDRTNRARARLRYVVEKLGMQTFREIYAAELEVVRADGAIPASPVISKVTVPAACQVPDVESVTTTAGVLRVVRQNQAGLVTVPLHVPLGVVAADDLDMLAGIAGQYSDERGLRATRDQNLLIRSVPESGLSRLMESLQALKTVQIVPSVLEHFVTCTGATTCRLGICSSRGVGKAVAEAFEEAGLRDLLQGLIVHVSGCPNSCGQHPLAALGLSGAQLRHEGHTVPMYKVMLGGGDHEAGAVFAKSAGALPARAVPGALVALLQDYQAHRKDAESFLAYVERQGIPYFELLLKPYQAIPSFADNPGFYSDWTLS